MAVFHHRVLSRGRFSGKIWVFETIEEVQPADVCYIFPQFHGQFPYLPLPISFAAPRIGSRVVCVGFSDHSADGGLSLDDVQSGRLNLLDIFEHKLRAVEARVTRIFRRRFTPGFIGGPCYSIDAELDHNMNGGPVFSESGYVCGILSGRATGFLGEPASIVSLLYPTLTVKVRFDGQMGAMRISSDLRLIDLIAQSSVTSDGSEHLLTKPGGTGEFSLWPAFPEEDADGLYNDFSDLEKQRNADR